MTVWKKATIQKAGVVDRSPAQAVPLKWAHDADSGEPRYIHDDEVVAKRCSCVCAACSLPLTPVLPGQPHRVRPSSHFRHPEGTTKESCVVVSARIAATRRLLEIGVIELPLRKVAASAVGFSGAGYEGWSEAPAETVAIRRAHMADHATALLTLDDGRQLYVDLTGTREQADPTYGLAVVSIGLSEPSLASMSIEEIRARLTLVPPVKWCSHWQDKSLLALAAAKAVDRARGAVDAWTDADEAEFQTHLPAGLDAETVRVARRETLLHKTVKAILSEAKSIVVPQLVVAVTTSLPDDAQDDDWDDRVVRKTWGSGQQKLPLEQVELERKLQQIVPDVIATLPKHHRTPPGATETRVEGGFEETTFDYQDDQIGMYWPTPLLIEVTVTHGIDARKAERIQMLDLPVLEIDFSSLGGVASVEGLKELVVGTTIGKRWVHHPDTRRRRRQLIEEISDHPLARQFADKAAMARHPHYLYSSAAQWATQYLGEFIAFHDENMRRWRQRRSTGFALPELEQVEIDQIPEFVEASDALKAHGFRGGMDRQFHGLLCRLVSLKLNRGVGYRLHTAFQVFNTITNDGEKQQRWWTLYTIAAKAFNLKDKYFNPEQSQKYQNWRATLVQPIKNRESRLLRPPTYDALIGILLPEMQPFLETGIGREEE